MLTKTTRSKNEQKLGRDNTQNSKSKKQINRVTGSNSPVVREMKIKPNTIGDGGEGWPHASVTPHLTSLIGSAAFSRTTCDEARFSTGSFLPQRRVFLQRLIKVMTK